MRLIDADEIMRRLSYNNGTPTVEYYNNGDPVTFEMREIKGLIRNTPTVSPWVKPSDRLPTEADAGYEGAVLASQKSYDDYEDYKIAIVHWETVVNFPEDFEFWSSIPPLPKKRAEE